jgi:outer membrane immunogenic protein
MNKVLLGPVLLILSPLALADGGFEGFYAGVQLGYHDGRDDGIEYEDEELSDYKQATDPSGASFGIFGGYNKLVTPAIVIGVEAGFEGRSQDDTSFQDYEGAPDTDYTAKADINSSWSLQARLGRIENENRTLLYVTGGFAGARIESTFCDLTEPKCESHSDSENGWTAGIGLEHLYTDNLSIKAEFSHADYGNRDVSLATIYSDGYVEKQEYSENSLRVALAYHF